MSKKKFTRWFVNGEKPARPGVYNVSCRRALQTGYWFARWNGRRWLKFSDSPDGAMLQTGTSILISPEYGSWRGLASDPKAKP